ncbi:unnamed protein product [Hermetia illucens]|uniref:Bacterial surface antigen (D15) domain-containing protein n=1 Tax=Hermetia illucens TaxID=343691 RepID=A0A7R8Z3K8_HERIL|nr:SAM50-like protein CG7639 [Hermetia illucens]CAD7094023.1 unnamed protein product [Hermetia illucens]
MGGKESKEVLRQPEAPARSSRRTRRELDLSVCPARVDQIHVSGLDRTRDDYVRRVAQGLFKAHTFQDVLIECNKARNHLIDLGIYKDIHVLIDVSRGPDATPNGYDVTFSGTEFPRLLGSVGTEVGQNEGSFTVELATPNIWGRGERLSLQGSYSNSKTSDVMLKLSKPFFHRELGDYKPEIALGLFRHATLMPVSAYKTSNVGLLGEFTFLLPFSIAHSLQYEMAFREVSTLGKQSPFFVREHCGPRMASLLRYVVSHDQRDSNVFPTRGFYVKLTNEYSGLGGNISYMMTNIHTEISATLFAGISAQLTSRVGYLQSVNKNNPEPPIGSLYTLGGPLTLRGFKFGGVGPHTDGYAMGAHSYWATGIHLWAPLPFNRYLGRFSNNFKTHLFYNFGNCNSFSSDKMRSAAGLGLAIRLAERARIEFNYCFPLLKQAGDRTHPGFQFGIGYEFL